MTDCFVRLGLSLAVIAVISVVFYQLSGRHSTSTALPMTNMTGVR